LYDLPCASTSELVAKAEHSTRHGPAARLGVADKPSKAEALTDAQAAAVTTDLAEISTALRDTLCAALPS
jgi:hypothetical protein